MRLIPAFAAILILHGCAATRLPIGAASLSGTVTRDHPRIPAPDRRTLQSIETKLAFWRDAASIGLPGVIAANDWSWRIEVRRRVCLASAGGARCDYEVRPCDPPMLPAESGRWCPRQRLFARGNSFASANGWYAVDAPAAED